jgi:hypothetical protein
MRRAAACCGSATSCWATGVNAALSRVVAVHVVSGRPTTASPLPGATTDYVTPSYGIACWSATSCLAVRSTGTEGLIIPLDNGKEGILHRVRGSFFLAGIGCTGPATCIAVGGTDADVAVAVPVTKGRVGSLEQVRSSLGLVSATWLSKTALRRDRRERHDHGFEPGVVRQREALLRAQRRHG